MNKFCVPVFHSHTIILAVQFVRSICIRTPFIPGTKDVVVAFIAAAVHFHDTSLYNIVYGFLVDPQEPLLASVERRKLAWFGHVTRLDSPSKTILQGTFEGGRCRGLQRKMLDGQPQRVDALAYLRSA